MQQNKLRQQLASWTRGLLLVSLTAAATTAAFAADVVVSGKLKREFFPGATRATVADGTAGSPASVTALDSFEAPQGVADNYAQRVSGWFVAPETGDYVFFVAADDDADLYLSTDETPANKRVIASESQWSNNRQWLNTGDGTDNAGDPTLKRSDTNERITLTKGRKYYIEGIQHEGGGGDNFSATFKLATADDPANGTASALTGSVIETTLPAGTITITTQPSAVSTIEGVTATFTVAADYTGVVPPSYQWRKNGGDIAGATSSSYTTPLLAVADNGTKYTVKIVVPGAEVVSQEATLTVSTDTIPPKIASAGGVRKDSAIEVGVIFDEKVKADTIVAGNFKLSSGTVTGVRLLENASGLQSLESGVVLQTTGLSAGSSYTVTVTGVADVKGNVMGATSKEFTVSSLTWAALGNEAASFPAAAVHVGGNGFNVNSGGNAFWNTTDDVTFVYEEVTGDFDKIVRVEYQDASSQWARAGLHARESLSALEADAARYQQVHANPTIKADGGASNFSFETNRRLSKGGATSSSNGGGTPKYPNAWLRLRRAGDIIHMYRSDDAVTWFEFNQTDFNPADGSLTDGPLPAKMYVGMVFGPENGNLGEEFRKNWAARFRNYGDYQPNKARGVQTYSIGVNFRNAANTSVGPKEIAGVDSVAQSNWNSVAATASSEAPVPLVADVNGTATASTATVEWTCPNTWASTGIGEENNGFAGSDRALLAGYLDTNNSSTTKVTVSALPSQLTGGYDVVVYALGGVQERGGAYRVTDLNGNELKPYVYAQSDRNPSAYKRSASTDQATYDLGSYVVFKGLTAKDIIIEGTTENGLGFSGTPRAPINAVQLVAPSGAIDTVASKPEISIARNGATTTITFKGSLQRASSVTGPFSDVTGATSPFTVSGTDAQGFFRARQ